MKTEELNVVDNFLSRETSYYLHNYLKTKTQPHYPDANHPNGLDRCAIYSDGVSVFADVIDETGKKHFPNGLDDQALLIFDILTLIKDSVGFQFNLPKNEINILGMTYTHYGITQMLPVHSDWGVSKYDVHSAVLYLTDDYEGGEFLWYDHYDWKNPETNRYTASKPAAGQLYYFEGTSTGQHEVAAVTSGERACIVFFYTGINLK